MREKRFWSQRKSSYPFPPSLQLKPKIRIPNSYRHRKFSEHPFVDLWSGVVGFGGHNSGQCDHTSGHFWDILLLV
ncbi:unnamed protein product, partial [Medioppia subpectinata]